MAATLPSAYLNITAAETSDTGKIPYPAIQAAVINRHKLTVLKLMWKFSANTILHNRKLEELENERLSLKKQIENLLLLNAELQTIFPKNITEEEYNIRMASCQRLAKTLHEIQKQLDNINLEVVYLVDYNIDVQQKFRTQMTQYWEQSQVLIDEKINLILDYLKTHTIPTNKSEQEIKIALKAALNHPDLQEAYLKAGDQSENKSLTAKLKGWFSA